MNMVDAKYGGNTVLSQAHKVGARLFNNIFLCFSEGNFISTQVVAGLFPIAS
jgi:hypothetical protein